MGHIKNHDKKSNRKVWIVVISIFLFLICGIIYTFDNNYEQKHKIEYDYTLRISNWIGSENYQFDYYKKNGNTYELYNKDSIKVNEVIPTDGYSIIITKNK